MMTRSGLMQFSRPPAGQVKVSLELATPQSEIFQQLTQLGWELQGIKFQGGQYVASGQNPTTMQECERFGDSPEMALAALYQHAIQSDSVRRQAYGAWRHHWYSDLHEIAKEYADLPPYAQNALEQWMTLAAECDAHARMIEAQIRIEKTAEHQSYETPKEMVQDVHHKGKLIVSTSDTNHPVWTKEQVVNFRIAHDVLGICQSGGGWSWPGANQATAHHMPHLSPLAQEALFVEVIGRTAYETVYRGLGGAKVGLMNDFLNVARKEEGEHLVIPKVAADWHSE